MLSQEKSPVLLPVVAVLALDVNKKGEYKWHRVTMMQQYFDIKEQYKDCILFFRLGDFYEMFLVMQEIASKELEITLTGRDCGQTERAPMWWSSFMLLIIIYPG